MAEENVASLRAAFEAAARGDAESMRALSRSRISPD